MRQLAARAPLQDRAGDADGQLQRPVRGDGAGAVVERAVVEAAKQLLDVARQVKARRRDERWAQLGVDQVLGDRADLRPSDRVGDRALSGQQAEVGDK